MGLCCCRNRTHDAPQASRTHNHSQIVGLTLLCEVTNLSLITLVFCLTLTCFDTVSVTRHVSQRQITSMIIRASKSPGAKGKLPSGFQVNLDRQSSFQTVLSNTCHLLRQPNVAIDASHTLKGDVPRALENGHWMFVRIAQQSSTEGLEVVAASNNYITKLIWL